MSQIKHLSCRLSKEVCEYTQSKYWRINLVIKPLKNSLLESWLKFKTDNVKNSLDIFIYELDKFPGVYVYREYLEDNPLVRGGLEMLKDIQEKENELDDHYLFSKISRTLEALFLQWD